MGDRSLEVLRYNAGGEVVSVRIEAVNMAFGNTIKSLDRQFPYNSESPKQFTKVNVAPVNIAQMQAQRAEQTLAQDSRRLDEVQTQAAYRQEAYAKVEMAHESQPQEEINYDIPKAA